MYENSALAQQASPIRTTEVQGAHEVLQKSCEELSMIASDLENRLYPVLSQRATGESEKPAQPEPLRVPVAQVFYDRSAQIYSVSKLLRSIIERLEV